MDSTPRDSMAAAVADTIEVQSDTSSEYEVPEVRQMAHISICYLGWYR